MASGDPTYAKMNVDWMNSPFWHAMSSNSCRVLNQVLWCVAVKERRCIIPCEYNPRWFAAIIHEDVVEVDNYLLEQTRMGLLSFTPDYHIVVRGVIKNHIRLHWKDEEPQALINPWVRNGPDYTWQPPDTDTDPTAIPQPTLIGTLRDHIEIESREKRVENREGEEETACAVIPPNKTQLLTTLLNDWNQTAKAADFRTARTIGKGTRRAAASARLDDTDWLESYPAALERIQASEFCKGRNDWKWKATIDWFVRPDTVTKILEGTCDNPPKPKGAHTRDDLPF